MPEKLFVDSIFESPVAHHTFSKFGKLGSLLLGNSLIGRFGVRFDGSLDLGVELELTHIHFLTKRGLGIGEVV